GPRAIPRSFSQREKDLHRRKRPASGGLGTGTVSIGFASNATGAGKERGTMQAHPFQAPNTGDSTVQPCRGDCECYQPMCWRATTCNEPPSSCRARTNGRGNYAPSSNVRSGSWTNIAPSRPPGPPMCWNSTNTGIGGADTARPGQKAGRPRAMPSPQGFVATKFRRVLDSAEPL